MSEGVDLDPLYVAARRVLIDALVTLAPHGKARQGDHRRRSAG